MRKFLLTVFLIITGITLVKAQNDTIFYDVAPLNQQQVRICNNLYDRALFYKPGTCNGAYWSMNGGQSFSYDNPLVIDNNEYTYCNIQLNDCDVICAFVVVFIEPNVPNETTEELWIHGGELAELRAVENDSASMYDIEWDTGETENIIYKPAGTYIAGISDMCATAYRTKIVNENVEIDLATCDLESNLNLITWQTNPAQAQYIDHVIVKRDGLQVGTADYSDGQFTDNIGSGSASRTYTLTAVATDGTECPIVSYPKETIHMAYLTGINNTIEVNWNVPAGYDLLGYNIC